MAKRRKPARRPLARDLGAPRTNNVRVPFFRFVRVALLAFVGVALTAWAAARAYHTTRVPMFVTKPAESAWPPPGTIDVTDVDLGAPTTSARPSKNRDGLSE